MNSTYDVAIVSENRLWMCPESAWIVSGAVNPEFHEAEGDHVHFIRLVRVIDLVDLERSFVGVSRKGGERSCRPCHGEQVAADNV